MFSNHEFLLNWLLRYRHGAAQIDMSTGRESMRFRRILRHFEENSDMWHRAIFSIYSRFMKRIQIQYFIFLFFIIDVILMFGMIDSSIYLRILDYFAR